MKNLAIFFCITFASITSGAGSLVCQNLFMDTEVEKSIRALAELRIQIDTIKAGGMNSLSVSSLTSQFHIKEESLISYLTANKIMSESEYFETITQEIRLLQENLRTLKKPEIDREKHIDVKRYIVDGNTAAFLPFKPKDKKIKPFEMMATFVTQKTYKQIADLINSKLPKEYNVYFSNALGPKNDRWPVVYAAFVTVDDWVRGLNELSRQNIPELKSIISNHEDNYVYSIPTEKEWKEFIGQAEVYLEDSDLAPYTSRSFEDVMEKSPLLVQEFEYYGLSGFINTMLDIDTPRKAGHGDERKSFRSFPQSDGNFFKVTGMYDWLNISTAASSNSFRLIRRLVEK